MEYTGEYKEITSKNYGKVYILKYKSEQPYPYCECTMCGKPIKRTMYVVQDENDIELEYLGSECIKHFITNFK